MAKEMYTECREEWEANVRRYRTSAKRILSTKGQGAYQNWLSRVYDYPLVPGMPGYFPELERSPLSEAEEKECLAKFRKKNVTLDKFFRSVPAKQSNGN